MVQYEGYVTKDGDLVVNMSGNQLSLREFLQATRVGAKDEGRREKSERRQPGSAGVAIAK